MVNKPQSAELLSVARAVLREQLIGELPVSKKYPAVMVANAMAIAARELEQAGPSRNVDRALADLMDAPQPSDRLWPDLIKRLRRGQFGAGEKPTEALRRLLLDEVTDRLRVSNPKILEPSDP